MIVSIFFLVCVGCLLAIYFILHGAVDNQQRWQHSFDFEFSAEDFYQSVQEAITKRKIPDVKFSRVKYSQGGLFNGSREYLHITKGAFIYDICAAPYGTGFFVSMWYAESHSVSKQIFSKIPIIKTLMETKSYYQIDTEAMAKAAIHVGFDAAIDELVSAKGARALGETERSTYKRK